MDGKEGEGEGEGRGNLEIPHPGHLLGVEAERDVVMRRGRKSNSIMWGG